LSSWVLSSAPRVRIGSLGAPATQATAARELVPARLAIEGFLHISEIAEEKVENIHNALKEGQVIKVKIISVIPEERKLGLSVKRVGQEDDEFSG